MKTMEKRWEGRTGTKKPPLRRLKQGLNGERAGNDKGPAGFVLDPAGFVSGSG
jgi:hypothetical protein